MTRRFSVLLLLIIFMISLVSVPAFAAKANKGTSVGVQPSGALDMYKREAPIGGQDDPIQGSGKPSGTVMQSLGFQAAASIVDLGATTNYDLGSNQSQPRQIIVGCSRVHAVFMQRDGANPTRVIGYSTFLATGVGGVSPAVVSAVNGGFPSLTTDGTGAALAGWHLVSGGGTFAAKDIACGAGSFGQSSTYPDSLPTGVGSGSEEATSNYIWPQIAMDLEADGDWYVHMIAHESTSTADVSGHQSLVYWRSTANSHNPQAGPAFFVDSITTISGTVIAHPAQADQRVAIVYTKPRDYVNPEATVFFDDNVVYRESNDGGANWGPIQTIYNFGAIQDEVLSAGTGFFERGAEVSGLYTQDGCLHVLFNSVWTDTGALFDGNGGYYLSRPRRVYHWDDCVACATVVTEARGSLTAPCGPGTGGLMGNLSKINLAECNNRLYAIYSLNKSIAANSTDTVFGPAFTDCSLAGFQNYDIIAKVSASGGATWGPDSNLTNTTTDNCTVNNCRSEVHLGTAEHTTDSLRILFMEDRDAGIGLNTNGALTNNPLKVITRNCFNMVTFTNLVADHGSIGYPLNVPPATFKDTTITVSNFGNISTNFTLGQTGGFISFPGGTSLIAPAGCTNSISFVARITAPAGPDSYAAGTITISYTSPDKAPQAVITIPVQRYSFVNFFLPQDASIRTSCNRMNVNQASEIANGVDGRRFSYFSDLPSVTGYLFDGFLILGNSNSNLSYSTFNGAGGTGMPTITNNYGFLYAATATTTYDSTTFANYRYATGKGYNRDTTIEFKSEYYAPKSPATCDFYVLVFTIYKGPKNPGGTISNLSVGYYADWDVPADSGSDNWGGFDASRKMVYQRGSLVGSIQNNHNRYGALGGKVDDCDSIIGGFVVDNLNYIYPEAGWHTDSLWNRMQGIAQNEYEVPAAILDATGTPDDLSMVLVLDKSKTIAGAVDTLKYAVVVAGSQSSGSITAIRAAVDAGYAFITANNLLTSCAPPCTCGDANGDGTINISDAVYLIAYIFAGGPAPNPICRGDANGDNTVNISDAVYLIAYIFAGGPAPHCPL